MPVVWQVSTQGKPLAAVQQFLMDTWECLSLDAMLLPLHDPEAGGWKPQVITSADKLSGANPFSPIMIENLALRIRPFLGKHAGMNLAVFLRPCEMRAWETFKEDLPQSESSPITISADCMGAYPLSEFGWRSERKGSEQELTTDLLQFSIQGGISSFRMRTACQLCPDPAAYKADISIHTLGIQIRENLLITANPPISDQLGKLDSLKLADREILAHHRSISGKLIDRNEATRQRLVHALAHNLSLDLESLVGQLNTCEACQSCMLGCPICTNLGLKPGKTLTRQEIAAWMVACVGCGMCEEHCPTHKPLVEIFAVIKDQLEKIN